MDRRWPPAAISVSALLIASVGIGVLLIGWRRGPEWACSPWRFSSLPPVCGPRLLGHAGRASRPVSQRSRRRPMGCSA
jgi:hypothetical protein